MIVVVVLVVVVVVILEAVLLLTQKCPLLILLDSVPKMYFVLLPLIFADISCYSWPYKYRTARKIDFSNFIFVLVETSKFFIFIKFALAAFVKLFFVGLFIGVTVIVDENHENL